MFFIKSLFFWTPLVLATSLLAGLSSFILLTSIDIVSILFSKNPQLVWGLPFCGVFITYLYQRFGKDANLGGNLLYLELNKVNSQISWVTAPLVYIASALTHLFGGSAGREGVAVQMTLSLTDQFQKFFHIEHQQRQILLKTAVAAGFSSVFGTPLAGALFALESPRSNSPLFKSILPCLASALLANTLMLQLGILHSNYKIDAILSYDLFLFLKIAFAGICFGITARYFSSLLLLSKKVFSKFGAYSAAILAALIVISFSYLWPAERYNGLGLEIIQMSFNKALGFDIFIKKAILTITTIAGGFKGGEVTPLFAIGSSLGSALSGSLSAPVALLAASGFISVFAGCVHAPWACAIMGAEIFGFEYLPFFIICCLVSNKFSGKIGIYTAQEIKNKKWYR